METIALFYKILLISGLILFGAGTFLFFIPNLLVKWNALGNTWLGDQKSATNYAALTRKLFSADYTIFANHRIIGGLMWGVSSLCLIVYILYR